jgi:hypothetical protein
MRSNSAYLFKRKVSGHLAKNDKKVLKERRKARKVKVTTEKLYGDEYIESGSVLNKKY